ncbi:MAG: MBL fold metallo-hydrolase, partial [Bacteroidota bacterium]
MSQLRQKRHFEVEFFEFVYSPLNLIPKRPVYCFLLDGILIDTAQSNMVRFFRKCFQEKQIDQVLITHFHEDHSGNIPVVQEWGKPVYAHPIGVELLKKPEKLPIVERWVWGESAAVSVNPITGSVESDKFKLEFIHTPGHSPDHLCFIEKNRGWPGVWINSSLNLSDSTLPVIGLTLTAALSPQTQR